MGSGETMTAVVPISAAPHFWIGDAPATRPLAGRHRGDLRLASGSSSSATGSTAAEKPMADSGNPDAGQPDETKPGEKPEGEQPPEFTGSAEQAEPDLDSNEEENLIESGWQ